MNSEELKSYKEVWFADFEFRQESGENPSPVCLVAKEYYSGHIIRLWEDELKSHMKPPFNMDKDALYVAYYSSAEMGCHLSLGWQLPENLLDLYPEFRNVSNGLDLPFGRGLLGALAWHGEPSIDTAEKEAMRSLIMRGGDFSASEKQAILEYCETDVMALARLFPRMLPQINMPLALVRGGYMKAVAIMEHNGIPIDIISLNRLRDKWDSIKGELISRIDLDYGLYVNGAFKVERFEHYLVRNNIPWPRLESGRLDLSDDTFKEMARSHPQLSPLRELRGALSQMKLADLSVGRDGRNRCMLSAYSSRTGRNQPSNSQYIFGPSVWLRSLIRPERGDALAYIDWGQQEFGIAAALSKDPLMMAAYQSGDPYLAFAKQAKAVPNDATKDSHKNERDLFKACVLAVQYGMGEKSLALRTGQSIAKARELLALHRETYKEFWAWSDAVVDYGILHNKLWTSFGWTILMKENPNPRFLRNFLMQANGAEMLRIACCLAVEQGVKVCAPVHDALLVEAPTTQIDEMVKITQTAMSDASAIVLDGFRLNTEFKIFQHPQRYEDDRGKAMWQQVQQQLLELESN